MTPDLLRISRLPDAGVRVHWPRRAPEQLFAGQPPVAALRLVPLLFTLCAAAQTLAAQLALAAAAGRDARAGDEQRAPLARESARETLRQLLLDCATAFDGVPADGNWLGRWRQARDRDALAMLAGDYVFGESPERWLARGESGWLDWIDAAPTAPAGWLARLTGRQAGCPLLPPLDAVGLARSPDDWLAPEGPTWQGDAREVGALRLEAERLPALMASGRLARARLLARLIRLARTLTGEALPATSVARLGDGALALVDTARGPLLHLAELEPGGAIRRYRVIPPTAWHSHPQGLIRRVLESSADDEAEWRRQLALIDPCVGVDIRRQPDEDTEDA